jgi:predicted transcriptional regulator
MKRFLMLILLTVSACTSYKDYYRLDDKYLSRRQQETRNFMVENEEQMISASAQVLQDLGFNIEESDVKLGLIVAAKDREAGSTAGKAGIVLLSLFSGSQPIYDVSQKIYVTLVSTKSKNDGYNVRVKFARIVTNSIRQSRIEKIENIAIYKDFFERLGQSLFLTVNNI